MANMQARMNNIAMIVPDAMRALRALKASAEKGGVPVRTIDLVELRASQINGCSVCVDMHARHLKKEGETDERLFAVAAWRDAPWFTDAERAALALTEAVTRLSDRADPVPDEIWDEAARHYDEKGACGPAHRDRQHQRLEPPQRRHPSGGGGVGRLNEPDLALKSKEPGKGEAPWRNSCTCSGAARPPTGPCRPSRCSRP